MKRMTSTVQHTAAGHLIRGTHVRSISPSSHSSVLDEYLLRVLELDLGAFFSWPRWSVSSVLSVVSTVSFVSMQENALRPASVLRPLAISAARA